MGLQEEMHSAVDNPPAPGFDLDQLIGKGHRHRVRSRVMLSAAGFLAVAMVIVGGYSLSGTTHRGGGGQANVPAAAPPLVVTHPSPADTTGDTARRLTEALSTLPAALHVDPSATFTYGGKQPGTAANDGYYYTSWRFDGVNVTIDVYPLGAIPTENGCAPGNRGDPSLSCDRTIDAHGTTYVVSNVDLGKPDQVTVVDAFRPDHTYVSISATTRGKLPAGFTNQLKNAAHAAGLTMEG